MSQNDVIAFRRSLGRTPPLDRMTVRVRGLELAVFPSPPVADATPLVLVNGGLIYDHTLLWPALAPLAAGRQVILYVVRRSGARSVFQAPPASVSVTGAAVAARLRRQGYDWRERLRALSTPVLVIHGERDALPATVALELVELLPRALHSLLPDAGHMPFWEAPARFFGAVTAFLDASTLGARR